jgi:hypothetical protein
MTESSTKGHGSEGTISSAENQAVGKEGDTDVYCPTCGKTSVRILSSSFRPEFRIQLGIRSERFERRALRGGKRAPAGHFHVLGYLVTVDWSFRHNCLRPQRQNHSTVIHDGRSLLPDQSALAAGLFLLGRHPKLLYENPRLIERSPTFIVHLVITVTYLEYCLLNHGCPTA